jgi:hypothetical protein
MMVKALAASILAIVYMVPSDREMIQRADEIFAGVAIRSRAEVTPAGGIVTISDIRVDRPLKGNVCAGDVVAIREFGGRVGDAAAYSPGTPVYRDGNRYLVFAEMNEDGERRTWGVGLGQFEFHDTPSGRDILVRSGISGFSAANLGSHVEHARDAEDFMAFIEGGPESYVVAEPRENLDPTADAAFPEYTRGSYLLTALFSDYFRQQSPVVTFLTSSAQPGLDGIAAVDQGVAQWNVSSGGIVKYARGGQDDTAIGGQNPDGKQTILFNDMGTHVGGAAGRAFVRCSGSACVRYSIDGEQFLPMTEVDIVISTFISTQSCLNSVMTHEVGHTLGFRHANKNQAEGVCSPPLDCDTLSVMTAVTLCSYNGQVQAWDQRAVTRVYGPESTPPPPDPVKPARRRAVRR